MNTRLRAAVSVVLALTLAVQPRDALIAAPDEELARSVALAEAARRFGLDIDAVTLNGGVVIQPWGISPGYYAATFSDGVDKTTAVWVDLETYEVLDQGAFLAATAHERGSLGKYSPELRAELDRLEENETTTIAVFYRSNWQNEAISEFRQLEPDLVLTDGVPVTGDDKTDRAAAAKLRSLRRSRLAEDAAAHSQAAWSMRLTVKYVSEFVPVMWLSGGRGDIEAFVERHGVLAAFPSSETALTMPSAYNTVEADYSFENDWKGQSTTVAVVEYDNVDWGMDDLAGLTSGERASIAIGGTLHTDGHPTWAMAAVASRTEGRKGIAPRAYFLSSATTDGSCCNQASDYEIIWAIERAVKHSSAPDVISLSVIADSGQNGFSGDGAQALSAYLDNLIDVENVHVAGSGGNDFENSRNCSNSPENRVLSPGSGWNVLSAGILDDNNTGSWSDDAIWYESPSDGDPGFCHDDPPANPGEASDRVKPEIAAPGRSVTFPDLPGFGTGTSIATPILAGSMAVLIGQNPSELRNWPEVVRAIIVAASDVHQVDPAAINSAEGYGSLSVRNASRIVERITGKTNFGRKTFNGTGELPNYGVPPSQTVLMTPSSTQARFVITWNSHGNYSDSDFSDQDASWSDRRWANFDLVVREADGTFIKRCDYQTANYEVCDWNAVAGRQYEVEIVAVSWGPMIPTESVGWARIFH